MRFSDEGKPRELNLPIRNGLIIALNRKEVVTEVLKLQRRKANIRLGKDNRLSYFS
jgi:hypothetical protein